MLVKERMDSGKNASEDELLREALHTLSEEEEDLRAVRDAVAELEAGDQGVALDDAFDTVGNKHRPSPNP